jgi:hypothetical protein
LFYSGRFFDERLIFHGVSAHHCFVHGLGAPRARNLRPERSGKASTTAFL